jgi:hypothetical protein
MLADGKADESLQLSGIDNLLVAVFVETPQLRVAHQPGYHHLHPLRPVSPKPVLYLNSFHTHRILIISIGCLCLFRFEHNGYLLLIFELTAALWLALGGWVSNPGGWHCEQLSEQLTSCVRKICRLQLATGQGRSAKQLSSRISSRQILRNFFF